MLKQAICFLALTLTACGLPEVTRYEVTACEVTTYAHADKTRKYCNTNYAEIIPVESGFVAYCVPNDISEECIYVSGRVDCSQMTDEQCDTAMAKDFERCLNESLVCN